MEDTEARSSRLSFGKGKTADGRLCSGARGLIGSTGDSMKQKSKSNNLLFRLQQKKVKQFDTGVVDPGFPRGGRNLLFDENFPKTAWKWIHFGPEGESLAPLDPPMYLSF